jgi:SAM-dependent methyltransferase
METIRPISHQSTNDFVFSLVQPHLERGARILDAGAGEGFFSKKMGDYLEAQGKSLDQLAACDLFPQAFRYTGIVCEGVSLDGRFPYDDASFDIVCSLEVIEHIEDQFHFTRELYRILKPGGLAIISTPNVLNINSRLRTLRSGFPVLFDPLPLSTNDPVHTSGHINPVSYYYLSYMLSRAGFRTIAPYYDRAKNSARALLALSGWYISLGNWLFNRRLRSKNSLAYRENTDTLKAMNSIAMLTSRSIIAAATK